MSLLYGGGITLLCYLLAALAWQIGGYILIISAMTGFVFIAPVLALGLYSISCQLQRGLRPRLGYCLREGRRHIGNELIISAILLVILLIWARAASMVHVFFPMQAEAQLTDFIAFLFVDTLVGALFSALVFMASAFSLPMLLDREVDAVTAVLTSIHAVLHNKGALLVWALIIGLALLMSVMTMLVDLAVAMPVLGYATWHGYEHTIDASDWPSHAQQDETGITTERTTG